MANSLIMSIFTILKETNITNNQKTKTMRKFNAKLGREVTYNFYPYKKFIIEGINSDGTLNLAIGTWKVLNVKVDNVCR